MIKDLIAADAPIEEYSIKGKKVFVRREDLRYAAPLPPNAKMSALYAIVERAASEGYKKVVLFAKKQQGTPYAMGLAPICQEFNIDAIIAYPASNTQAMPEWLQKLQTDFINVFPARLHPNMVTINVNQCKQIAEKRDAYFIPF